MAAHLFTKWTDDFITLAVLRDPSRRGKLGLRETKARIAKH